MSIDSEGVRFPSLDELRARRTAKWTLYPGDVLPSPVAEMDVLPAVPVRQALVEAVERGATGYPPMDGSLVESFCAFAQRRWSWSVAPEQVFPAVDVGAAVTDVVAALAGPGPVVICTPVYDGFGHWPEAAGRQLVDVPLLRVPAPAEATGTSAPSAGGGFSGDRYRLDVEGIERAFAQGASALLLCHPHNPVGRVHSREELAAVARAAARHGAIVVSDEVHAPLVFPDAPTTSKPESQAASPPASAHGPAEEPFVPFVPFLASCPEAREVGVAVHSPSKAWNVAGLKCALVVAGSGRHRERLAGVASAGAWAVGTLGVFAAEAAYARGEGWLDELVGVLRGNHLALARGLREHLPVARVSPSAFGFLAWVDLGGLGWPGEASDVALEHGRVALGVGSAFGAGWSQYVRVNLGLSPQLVPEVVSRLARADAVVRDMR